MTIEISLLGLADVLCVTAETHYLLDAILDNRNKAATIRNLSIYLERVQFALPKCRKHDTFRTECLNLAYTIRNESWKSAKLRYGRSYLILESVPEKETEKTGTGK